MSDLQSLITRRAQLQAELTAVEEAIKAYGDARPVHINTRRNLRNTSYVTVDPERAKDETYGLLLMIFSDESLTIPADSSWNSGWVVRAIWEQWKLQCPDMVGVFIWE